MICNHNYHSKFLSNCTKFKIMILSSINSVYLIMKIHPYDISVFRYLANNNQINKKFI